MCYEQGLGIQKDLKEAFKFYEIAAKAGYVKAQTKLASYYFDKKDFIEALKWFQLAAEQGDPLAQEKIGEFYEKGYGVLPDLNEAMKWYRLAASNYSHHKPEQSRLQLTSVSSCPSHSNTTSDYVSWEVLKNTLQKA